MKRHAARLIGSLFIQIRSYPTFEHISLDLILVVSFFRHSFSSTTPAKLVTQNVEVVSIARLNDIESCAALAYHNSISNLHLKTDLPVKRQSHLFVISLQ